MAVQYPARGPVKLMPLVVVTLVNYLAQVPYYLYNDYSPQHVLPGLRAVALLGATLVWFGVGLGGYLLRQRWGLAVLVSFLVAEALFYAATIATGIFLVQLANPSNLLRVVFVIGYGSGGVAAVYAYRLLRGHLRPNLRPGDNPAG